jgi:hypothetical protein
MKHLILIECGKMDGGQALAVLERLGIKNFAITPERLLEIYKQAWINWGDRVQSLMVKPEISAADIQKALEEMRL